MITKKIKNLKPTEIDVTLKYVCPECLDDHWVRLKQSQLKGYTIACDCGAYLKIKQVDRVILKHTRKTKNIKESVDPELIKNCSKTLVSYGFSIIEAESLIRKAYDTINSNNPKELIKFALSTLEKNDG